MGRTIVQKDGGKIMPEVKSEEKVTAGKVDNIQRELFKLLGKPPKLYKVKAHPIMKDTYRVNVWCGEAGYELITHSYFMTFQDGLIVKSNPEVKKLY